MKLLKQKYDPVTGQTFEWVEIPDTIIKKTNIYPRIQEAKHNYRSKIVSRTKNK